MPFPIGMAIGAVAGLLGSKYSADSARRGQAAANRMNMQLQQQQQGWEQMMANTEVQRRKADLEAAGFNPMLSFTSGQAASTPNVAPAHVESETEGSAKIMSGGISSALAGAMLKSQFDNMEADTTLKTSSAAQIEAQTANLRTMKANIGAEYDKISSEVERIKSETELNRFVRERLQPLQAAFQESVNKIKAAGVPEAEAEAKVWNELSEKVKAGDFDAGMGAKFLIMLRSIFK